MDVCSPYGWISGMHALVDRMILPLGFHLRGQPEDATGDGVVDDDDFVVRVDGFETPSVSRTQAEI